MDIINQGRGGLENNDGNGQEDNKKVVEDSIDLKGKDNVDLVPEYDNNQDT